MKNPLRAGFLLFVFYGLRPPLHAARAGHSLRELYALRLFMAFSHFMHYVHFMFFAHYAQSALLWASPTSSITYFQTASRDSTDFLPTAAKSKQKGPLSNNSLTPARLA
ncbi:MAG: hypothetical protein CL578_17805 [Alteromonadaceae bacterium]|nr:hypothetical protein [Alteromonadaceae bacterium]